MALGRMFRYFLSPDPDSAFSNVVSQIPGLTLRKSILSAPENAAWLAEQFIASHGYRAKPIQIPDALPPVEADVPPYVFRAVPFLRDWVPDFLLPFQRQAIAYALHRSGTLLFHPPGAGKTLSSIVWALAAEGRTLVVTRNSVCRQWASEVAKYTEARAVLVEGFRLPEADWDDPRIKFVIVGWHSIAPLVFCEKSPFFNPRLDLRSLILDEIHNAKSNKRRIMIPVTDGDENDRYDKILEDGTKVRFEGRNNRAEAAEHLSRYAQRRLGATGTPVRNRLNDLWGQLDLLEPRGFGTYQSFTARYCEGHYNAYGGWEAKGCNRARLPELNARLGFVIHHVPVEVTHSQLPRKRRVNHLIPFEALAKTSSVSERYLQEAAISGKASHATALLQDAASRKRDAIAELVEESLGEKNKIVVFTGLRKDVGWLKEAIQKRLKRNVPQIWAACGEDSLEDRFRIQNEYLAHPGPCVLVATHQSFGEGLNLSDTDIAILAMLPVTPGELTQTEGRFLRLTTKRPVVIYYTVAQGTVDERHKTLLLDKLPQVTSITPGGDTEVAGMISTLSGGVSDMSGDEFVERLLEKIND